MEMFTRERTGNIAALQPIGISRKLRKEIKSFTNSILCNVKKSRSGNILLSFVGQENRVGCTLFFDVLPEDQYKQVSSQNCREQSL